MWCMFVSVKYIPTNKVTMTVNNVCCFLIKTRSSAITEEPHNASCQLKSCQLPRNSAETLVRQVLNKSKL